MQSEFCTWQNFIMGQELTKMHTYVQYTSSGDGQTLCKVRLASNEQRRCSNKAKTRNRLKFARMPQTYEPISAASRPEVYHIVRTCGRDIAV